MIYSEENLPVPYFVKCDEGKNGTYCGAGSFLAGLVSVLVK